MVGLFIDMFCFPLGTADVIDSFFHTISWNLEKKNRGSRFPVIMKELYDGEVPLEHMEDAAAEIKIIRRELERLPRSFGVWVYQFRTDPPPRDFWENKTAPNLSKVFLTESGGDMLDDFEAAIKFAIFHRCGLKLEPIVGEMVDLDEVFS